MSAPNWWTTGLLQSKHVTATADEAALQFSEVAVHVSTMVPFNTLALLQVGLCSCSGGWSMLQLNSSYYCYYCSFISSFFK